MNIVLKWIFKTLLSDIPRLLLTVCSIAAAFTMLTAMGLSLESQMLAIGSLNEGVSKMVVTVLQPTVLVAFALTLYVLFAVSLAERKSQFRIMRTAGTTTRQLLHGLFAEAMALDAAGAALGIGAGFLLAWLLLRGVDVPLHPEVFWSSAVFLRGVLPAFALAPVMMLLNAPVLLREKQNSRRKKPPKKPRAPFKTRLLPRLFGAGGSLEHALGRQQRRHRVLLVAAIVVNVVALFLVTAGFSILSNMDIISENDMSICFSDYPRIREDYHTDGDRLRDELKELLEDCRNEGLLEDFLHVQSYGTHLCVIDDTYLSDAALADYIPEKNTYTYVYRLNDRQHCGIGQLSFLDDETFDRYLEENGIAYSGSGGVFINNDLVNDKRVTLIGDLPETGGIVLYPYSEELYNMRMEADAAKTDSLPESAEELLAETPESVFIRPGAFYNKRLDTFWERYRHPFGGFDLICPASQKQAFDAFNKANGDYSFDYVYIRSTDTQALYRRLQSSLDGKYGYTFRLYHFSDGNGYWNPKVRTEETSRLLQTGVEVRDYQTQTEDFQRFLTQTKQIYRFFIVMVFLMIALNIVNVVHMNRLSRRREYAILLSLGLGGRQRLGMTLYESFRLTAGAVLCGAVSMILAAKFIYPVLDVGLAYENLTVTNLDYIQDSNYTIFDELLMVAKDLWLTIRPCWPLIVFAVLFLFFGFVIAERLIDRQFEKDELVIVLKDDMHE